MAAAEQTSSLDPGSLPKVDEGTQTGARGVMDTAVVRELLQQTMAALRRDVQALVCERGAWE